MKNEWTLHTVLALTIKNKHLSYECREQHVRKFTSDTARVDDVRKCKGDQNRMLEIQVKK